MNKIEINGIFYNATTELTLSGKIVAITGHRPHKLGFDYDVRTPLMRAIRNRLQGMIHSCRPDYMISGMALGIDMLWAQLALTNKIPLIAAVPCVDQGVLWPSKSQQLYYRILSEAHMVVNVSGQIRYRVQYMQLRNIWMVDCCTRLVGVWDGSPGGTANCITYAKTKLKNTQIQIINPSLLGIYGNI